MLLRGNGTNSLNLVRGIGKPGLRLRPASPHHLSDGIVHTLLEAIAQGRLQPGMTLPSEMRLARAAQVSRVTMRSALERLKAVDLISSRRGGETRVALPEAPGRGVDLLTRDYLHTLDDVGHVMEMLLIYALRQGDARGAADEGPAIYHFASLSADIQDSSPDAARHLDVLSFLAAASQSPLCQYMFQLLGNSILCFFEKACDGARRLGTLPDIDALAQQMRVPVASHRFEPALPILKRYMALLREAIPSARPYPSQDPDQILDLLTGLSRRRISDFVIESLQSLFSSRNQACESRLPSERMLADQLGVSRSSIQTALSWFREQGYIDTSPRSGTRMARRPELPANLHSEVKAKYRTHNDMCEIRSLLEPWAVGQAARNVAACACGAESLKTVLNETRWSSRMGNFRSIDDLRFHSAIAKASGSAVYRYLVEANYDVLFDYFDFSLTGLSMGRQINEEIQHHHASIVHHIERGEPAEAASWQAEHSHSFQTAYRECRGAN